MKTNETPRRSIPTLLLEKYRLDELDAAQKKALVEEFGSKRIDHELSLLAVEEAAFLMTSSRMAPQFPAEPGKKAPVLPFRLRLQYVTPLLIAAAAFLIVYQPLKTKGPAVASTDGILLKGAANPLLVMKQTEHGPVSLKDGSEARPGDVIQLVYEAGSFDYGLIFSVDGRGNVTWHFPEDSSTAAKLILGKPVPLKNSFLLDESPRFERFFFLRSHRAIPSLEWEKVAKSIDLSKDGRLPLDSEIDQFSILLRK